MHTFYINNTLVAIHTSAIPIHNNPDTPLEEIHPMDLVDYRVWFTPKERIEIRKVLKNPHSYTEIDIPIGNPQRCNLPMAMEVTRVATLHDLPFDAFAPPPQDTEETPPMNAMQMMTISAMMAANMPAMPNIHRAMNAPTWWHKKSHKKNRRKEFKRRRK